MQKEENLNVSNYNNSNVNISSSDNKNINKGWAI